MNKDQLYTEIVLEAFKFSGLLTAEGDRITEKYGLSSARWKVIGALARAKSPLTVPQIARTMGQTRQAVQRLVDSMVNSGLLSLKDNPEHKRAKLVCLTEQGQDVFDALNDEWQVLAAKYASVVSPDDLQTTLATLTQLSLEFLP